MLPSSLHSVKTATEPARRNPRARCMQLTVLGVLSAHALLLVLIWNGRPAPDPARQADLIEVTVLGPSASADRSDARRTPAARAGKADDMRSPLQPASQPEPEAGKGTVPKPSAPGASMAAPASSPAGPSPPAAGPGATPATDLRSGLNPAPAAGLDATGSRKPATAQAADPAPARIELPDSGAAYLDNPRPPYPALSRRLGEQGRVVLRVWVEADGRPGRIELRSGSGFERLDRAALQTVQRWRFLPGKKAGVPEAMWVEVPLQFVLE